MRDLAQREISPRIVRNGQIIQLSHVADGMFEWFSSLNGGIPTVNCSEHGGRSQDGDLATVVCGPNGEELTPYFRRREAQPCSNTAQFSYPVLVTVTASASGSSIIIIQREARHVGAVAFIDSQTIWCGKADELPEEHECFRAAVEAACRKSRCSGCTHVHFAKQWEHDDRDAQS